MAAPARRASEATALSIFDGFTLADVETCCWCFIKTFGEGAVYINHKYEIEHFIDAKSLNLLEDMLKVKDRVKAAVNAFFNSFSAEFSHEYSPLIEWIYKYIDSRGTLTLHDIEKINQVMMNFKMAKSPAITEPAIRRVGFPGK